MDEITPFAPTLQIFCQKLCLLLPSGIVDWECRVTQEEFSAFGSIPIMSLFLLPSRHP